MIFPSSVYNKSFYDVYHYVDKYCADRHWFFDDIAVDYDDNTLQVAVMLRHQGFGVTFFVKEEDYDNNIENVAGYIRDRVERFACQVGYPPKEYQDTNKGTLPVQCKPMNTSKKPGTQLSIW